MDASSAVPGSLSPDSPDELGAGLEPGDRKRVKWGLIVLAVLSTFSTIGVALSAYMVNNHPLLLIGISPLMRHMILVAPIVDPIAFLVVGVSRSLLFCSTCYVLGRALGPTAIHWLEPRAKWAAGFLRWLQRVFNAIPHLALIVMAGPGMSAIAGMSGMRPITFVPMIAGGLLFRMILVLYFAEWLSGPITGLLAVIKEYQLPVTAVLIIGVAIYQWVKYRRKML